MTRDRFTNNPFTQLMGPSDVKSKRFIRDKLNITDIEGSQPDVYKKQRNIEGRDCRDNYDIEGTQPMKLKGNHMHEVPPRPDYKLFTKDINPGKWVSKRNVDPLNPSYEMKSGSGRVMSIGAIERSSPP